MNVDTTGDPEMDAFKAQRSVQFVARFKYQFKDADDHYVNLNPIWGHVLEAPVAQQVMDAAADAIAMLLWPPFGEPPRWMQVG